jgi:hypothetical protein
MSLWLTIPVGVGVIAAFIAVIRRGRAGVTTLHIDR